MRSADHRGCRPPETALAFRRMIRDGKLFTHAPALAAPAFTHRPAARAAGFVGGFVSSTATIGTMGARAAREPRLLRGSVAAGVASTVATVVFLAMVVGAASPAALRQIVLPLVFAGVAAGAYALLFAWRAATGDPEPAERGRAIDLRTALVRAASVSALLVISAALEQALGRSGALLAIAVAGFADSQTAAFSARVACRRGPPERRRRDRPDPGRAHHEHREQGRRRRSPRTPALRARDLARPRDRARRGVGRLRPGAAPVTPASSAPVQPVAHAIALSSSIVVRPPAWPAGGAGRPRTALARRLPRQRRRAIARSTGWLGPAPARSSR
jgi:hypothetical protein